MKKRKMRSIWVVSLTALVTVILGGAGAAAYFYWKENFSKPKEENATKQEAKLADKVKGNNLVLATTNEDKLALNYLRLDNDQKVKKEIKLDTAIKGSTEAGKNPLVQFDKDGGNLVYAEIKEHTITDENSYFKLIKANFEGEEQETLVDAKGPAELVNFLYKENKVFYLKSNTKTIEETPKTSKNSRNKDTTPIKTEVTQTDLLMYDTRIKKEETLAQDVGNFFQKEMDYVDGKVTSLYREESKKEGYKFFEITVDPLTKRVEKNFLFSYKKNKEFELNVQDIYPSPSHRQYLYKDYSAKEGNTLKIYSTGTKKIQVVAKGNLNFDKIYWLSEDEIVYLKSSSSGNLTEETQPNEIVKINTSSPNAEESFASSTNIITPLLVNSDYVVYIEDSKVICLKGKDKKEFQTEGLSEASNILYVGGFEY